MTVDEAFAARDLTFPLGPNFKLLEFVNSQTASMQQIDNFPAYPVIIERLGTLVNAVLEPVRTVLGKPVRIHSGYRCDALNRAVGGVKDSQHLIGEAADISIDGLDNYDLARWIEQTVLFDQLILEGHRAGVPGSGWVHVSYHVLSNRRDVLTMHDGAYEHGLDNRFLA